MGLLCGLALLGMQFVMTRPGPSGKRIDGRNQVDCNPMVVVPIIGAVVALVVYRVGCLYAYQCVPLRLVPLRIPMDIFFAVGGIVCLLALKRRIVRYDDCHVTIGWVFRRPETIEWAAIRQARWVGRYGELLIVWEGGTREIDYWWRGAGQFVDALRSHGVEVAPAPRPFKTS